MKRLLISAIAGILILPGAFTQNIDDALRYSQVFYNGTARFISMGGAFSSLGADLSSIALNPAGMGMFRSFELSISPQLNYNNSSASFNGTRSDDFRYTFGLSQGGIVSNLISRDQESGLISLSAAYTYNNTNRFNENTTISGISDNSSMADYWARVSEGIFYKDLKGAKGIAYDVWVMDTITGSGGLQYGTVFSGYGENTNSTYGQTIRRIIGNEGSIGQHSFSIGGNYSNKLYFGASLGISSLRYTGHYEHLEADYDNVITDFKNFAYTDHFEANGTGYSIKLGGIVRPVEPLRIGFAFHSPVIYRIHEYFYDNISSEFDNFDQYEATNNPLRYSYTLTTPFRALTGASLQIRKLGIISADYEFVDYRMARFSRASDDYNYSGENESIKDILKSTSNIRLGAEFRIQTLYIRGGYGIYGSAFTRGEVNENLTYNTVSFGLGFRQDSFFFDLAFANLSSSQKYYMYDDPPYLSPATITSSKNTFTATLGVKF